MTLGITSKSKASGYIFEAGTYPATLIEVKSGERKKFKENPDSPDEKEPAIFFVFQLDEKTNPETNLPVELAKVTGTSNYWGTERFPKRSGLVDFVASISPKAFNREECEGNDALFEKRVKMLEGKKFYLTVAPNQKGTYMNITNAMLVPPASQHPTTTQKVEPKAQPKPPVSEPIIKDDDDIPF